jgi:hypothetical protein
MVKKGLIKCDTFEKFKYFLEDKRYSYCKNFKLSDWEQYEEFTCLEILNNELDSYGELKDWKGERIAIYTFDEWLEINEGKTKIKTEEKTMENLMLDVLTKTYNNSILRQNTVPLFMSNPGLGKTSIIRKFAKDQGVRLLKITLSQRMPNEVVGGLMPDKDSKTWEVYVSHELKSLKDGDILFFDEVFNGTLKQTLDALLNLLEDRMLPDGTHLADVMIVAASNPQGVINLTPQIKERFIKYDLKFDAIEFQNYLKYKYGMPNTISSNLCTLINKEKFELDGAASWNYLTPRSIEKALMQMGCDGDSPYKDMLLPFLSEEIIAPADILPIDAKKGDNIKYIELLKLIVQLKYNVTDNKEEEKVAKEVVAA